MWLVKAGRGRFCLARGGKAGTDAKVVYRALIREIGMSNKVLDQRVFQADQVIFREGQPGDVAYIIVSGRVCLTKSTDGGERIIAFIGENEIFGEMALIDAAPRMATAAAVESVVCTVVNQAQLQKKLAAVDADARTLFRFLLKYVRETLPYEIRGSVQRSSQPSADEAKACVIINSPGLSEELRHKDPFLHALFDIMVGYTRRRLPPGLK